MQKIIYVIISTDWDQCLWWTEDFKTAYQILVDHLNYYSDTTYIDMYKIPNNNIQWAVSGWAFELMYCWQPILSDDFESMNIEYHCILEWSCYDDIRAVCNIADLCDLSFKKK